MNPITSFIKRHPQVTFWGIVWSVNFFGWFMASIYPSDLWLFLIYSVLLAGAFVTAIADGRSGLKTYFSRIIRWRVGIKWYAVALFLPLILRLVAFGMSIASGARLTANFQMPELGELLFEFILVFFIIGLGEEPGFRGFALPRFLANYPALTASLILGVLHGIWHLPNFLTSDIPPLAILIIISGAILNTWLFNNTRGSVFMAMLMHASVNLWAQVFNPFLGEADAARQETWLAITYVIMAVLLVIFTGRELGRKPVTVEPAVSPDRPLMAK